MNNSQQNARVGLFFLLGLALIWVTFQTLNGGKIFKDPGYTLVAGFESLKELKVGDEVRMAGVKIGAVEQTRLAGRRAEAILRIDPKIEIKTAVTPDLNTIMGEVGALGKKLETALGSISTTINGDEKNPGLFQKLGKL